MSNPRKKFKVYIKDGSNKTLEAEGYFLSQDGDYNFTINEGEKEEGYFEVSATIPRENVLSITEEK